MKPLKKALRTTAVLAVVMLAFFMLMLSKDISKGIQNGIEMVLGVIVPSLFAFMALSVFIANTFVSDVISRTLRPVAVHLYRLPANAGFIIFMSMIGGYPVGAKLISDMLRAGTLDEKTASRMMCYCTNAGPAFIVTAVGVGMFHSLTTGFFLFIAQILSSVIMGIVIGRCSKPVTRAAAPKRNMSVPNAFVYSVNSAAKSLFGVSAFVVLFSGVIEFLKASGIMDAAIRLFSAFLDKQTVEICITGFLEVTNGCKASAALGGSNALLLTAFFLSFAGISILFQIVNMFYGMKVNLKPFLLSRVVHGGLTAALTYLLIRMFPQAYETAVSLVHPIFTTGAYSVFASVCLLCMGVILILSIKIEQKNTNRHVSQ